MNSNNFEKRYNTYSNEKLLDIVTINKNSYSEEALQSAEKILTTLGVKWLSSETKIAEVAVDEQMEPRKLDLPNEGRIFLNEQDNKSSNNLKDRFDTLVEDVEKNREEISEQFKIQYEVVCT